MPNITTVYSAGLDALANLYEVQMTTNNVSALFGNTLGELIFRIQDFSIPASEISTYEINYGPWAFDRPNGKVNANRTISFNVRIDKDYELYQSFVNWKNSIQNEYTGAIASLDSLTETFSVYPITASGDGSSTIVSSAISSGVIFEKCWPSSVGEIGFSQDSGDIITASITLTFLRMLKDINSTVGGVSSLTEISSDDAV